MNIIEQAAKRLEELRRAGADISDQRTLAPVETFRSEPRTSDGGSTPEALMRALDARKVDHVVGDIPSMRPETAHAPTPTARPTSRKVDIELERLKARGFVTPDAPQSQIADEFRVIKRPIIRNALGRGGAKARGGNLIMVTSALPGEGKTFTAVNLAMSVAMEFDNTVLLVDGDVAHPMLPSVLGVPESPGLLDLLTGDKIDVADALVKTNVDKLSVLPAGSRHRRATELLASEQMGQLLRELASRYSDRIIIFDSPPLLATTEARVLATHMGQIIMVVAADSTTQPAIKHALSTIESCEIVLMVLNKASQTDVGAYYGYYADSASG